MRARRSAEVTILEICESVNEGLRGTTFADVEDEDVDTCTGVPKDVDDVRAQNE